MKHILMSTMAVVLSHRMEAETARRLPSGIEFTAPGGWEVKIVNQAAVLSPPGQMGQLEVYMIAPLAAKSLQDPNLTTVVESQFPEGSLARRLRAPRTFQAAGGPGAVISYSFRDKGMSGLLDVHAVDLREGGLVALIAGGTTELMLLRGPQVEAVAASFRYAAGPAAGVAATVANTGSSLAQQWTRRLSDKKLVQFSSYSSGSSGGYNSQKTLYLVADGSYAFRSSSSVSVYVPGATGSSAGSNGNDGRWRVYEQNGAAILELRSSTGTVENVAVSTDGSKTFLNGRRWFMVGIRE